MNANVFHFYQSVLQDPLFAAEGMDLEQGVAAIERVEQQCAEAEKLIAEGAWMRKLFLIRHPIAKYAFPLTFLRAFIEGERQRRLFLAVPTVESAKRLVSRWQEASRAYTDDVRRYRYLHDVMIMAEKKSDTFQFEDFAMNVTSLADVKKALALFEKNAHALSEDVARREALLTHGTPYATTRYVHKLPAHPPASIPPRYQRLVDLDVEHGFPYRDRTIVETLGPFMYTLQHFDRTPTDHAFYAFIVEDKDSQARFLKVSLADRFYFMDLTHMNDWRGHGVQALHAPLIERGITHWYQSVTHGYATRDQLYVADMATAFDLVRRPWLNREQISLQRSSMLDLILMGASFDLDMYLENTKTRSRAGLTKGYSHLDTLLIRTHPSLFFLPFNASVWRLEELPNFLGTKRTTGEPKYKTYDEIESTLPDGMIERIMQGGKIRAEARKQPVRL